VCTRPLSEKIRGILYRGKQFFLAQNAPKSFVTGLRPDLLGELTALPQTP